MKTIFKIIPGALICRVALSLQIRQSLALALDSALSPSAEVGRSSSSHYFQVIDQHK